MAKEAFYYGEEKTGLFVDILRAGIRALGSLVPYQDRVQILKWCDETISDWEEDEEKCGCTTCITCGNCSTCEPRQGCPDCNPDKKWEDNNND